MAEPERLNVLLISGEFERAHYALAMASSAAALDQAVTLFATQGGVRAFLADDGAGRPGWAGLRCTGEFADATDGAELDARYRARGVAGFEDLLQACIGLGVEFMVCEMGVRALGLETAELRADLPVHAGGLATLLARGGRLIVL
ncbi:MAG: DsrE family protein [Geminicoccaceae bacterium]